MVNQGAVKGPPRPGRRLARVVVACSFACLAWPAWAQSDGSDNSLQSWQTAPPKDGAPAGRTSNGMLTLHSDLRFSLLAASRKSIDADTAQYQAQVKRVATRLEAAAKKTYPEVLGRVGHFDVFVADTQKLYAMSSGSGRIAVSAGFATIKPTDDWIAFVIAREMGHVIAGHHDSNAGASLATSLAMNLIVPGSGVIKTVLSLGGAELASGSGRERQGGEADAVAMKLLTAAGYSAKAVVRSAQLRPLGEEVSTSAWANDYRASIVRLGGKAAPQTLGAAAPRRERTAPAGAQAQLVSWKPGDVRPARRSGAVAAPAATVSASYAANSFSLGACAGCWSSP